MLAWLSVWSEVQTCIWPSGCHCHSLFLASVKSRLVLPFWYRLTQVVPEKGPLNGYKKLNGCWSPLQAVTYTLKVVVSKKWCKIDTLLLHTTNRKYHMAYRFVPVSMTLVNLERHLPVAGLINSMQFNERLCDFLHGFNWDGTSRGPSAIVERLVYLSNRIMYWRHPVSGCCSVCAS